MPIWEIGDVPGLRGEGRSGDWSESGGIMTTFSAYLDALTRQQPRTRSAQGHWLISRSSQHVFLYLVDLVVITSCLVFAFTARGLMPFDGAGESAQLVAMTAPLLVAVWLIMLKVAGAFQLRHLRAGVIEYKRVVTASFAMAGLVGIGSYLLKAEFPRGIFVLLFGLGTTGLVLSRFARRKIMGAIHRQGALMTPIVVAGDAGHVDEIAKVLRRETWL